MSTMLKRDKERAREAKAQEKRDRRQERKVEKKKTADDFILTAPKRS